MIELVLSDGVQEPVVEKLAGPRVRLSIHPSHDLADALAKCRAELHEAIEWALRHFIKMTKRPIEFLFVMQTVRKWLPWLTRAARMDHRRSSARNISSAFSISAGEVFSARHISGSNATLGRVSSEK